MIKDSSVPKQKQTKEQKQLGFLLYHGVHLQNDNGGDWKGECPFCHKQNHFFANPITRQWDCKSCHMEGNHYSFLQEWGTACLQDTQTVDYKELASERGIPVEALRNHQVAFDRDNERWIIPIFGRNGKAVNLRALVNNNKGKPKLQNTTGMDTVLWNYHNLKEEGPVYICEGEWDGIILDWLIDQTEEEDHSFSVIAAPGSFKQEWVGQFKDRDVKVLFDNDTSGKKLQDKVTGWLKKVVGSLQSITWPSGYADKYDVRDFITDRLKKIKKKPTEEQLIDIWDELHEIIEDEDTEEQEEEKKPKREFIKIETFKEVITTYKKHLDMSEKMEIGLAIMFAVTFSSRLDGVLPWFFIVGPSSAGKTILLQSFQEAQRCEFVSSLTPHSLVSGWQENRAKGEKDPSLLKQWNGKMIIFKEYTEILQLPITIRQETEGVLRGAHDGRVQKKFGNGVERDFETRFGLLAGVTSAIYRHTDSTCGDRFLKYILVEEEYNRRSHILKALQNEDNAGRAGNELRIGRVLEDTAGGFLEKEITNDSIEPTPLPMLHKISALGEIVECLRVQIDKDGKGRMHSLPEVAFASRAGTQLLKVGKGLSFVYGKKKIDSKIYSILKKIGLDTASGWAQKIMKVLVKQKKPLDREEIAELSRVSTSEVYRTLSDMVFIFYQGKHLIQKNKEESLEAGQPKILYIVNQWFKDLWKEAELGRK